METLKPNNKLAIIIKSYLIVIVYGFLSIILELFSLLFFDCSPYITHPIFPVLLCFTILFPLLLFKSQRVKAIFSTILLILQCILLLGLNYLFLSNGTFFENSMISQRNDAYATIEQFYLTPGLLFICACILVGYIVFLIFYLKKCRKAGTLRTSGKRRNRIIIFSIYLIVIAGLLFIPISNTLKSRITNYDELLYGSDNSYQELGACGNFVFEMISAVIPKLVITSDLSKLESTIYSERCDVSEYNAVSSGNNLIMILAESLEWYPMHIYSEELTKKIYPNLSRLVDQGVICDNFYSKEKTDTAEALTLIGSNPTGKYVHNDFSQNSYPYSIPNMFHRDAVTDGDEDVVIRSFHQNDGNFYNRSTIHKSFGFEELVDISSMVNFGVENTWNQKQRERNLDSLTMNAMKDEMFPTDKRFFTYWITFSTHGFYNERSNLKEYYDIFDNLGVFPKGSKYDNYLRTYAAAVADLDKALGIMLDDLEQKGLLANTTILMVADHNTYYNGLSNYAKDIDTNFNPELFRVPMIIYDQKLAAFMDNAGKSRTISKFTTTSDVIPTLLDLLGIPGWKNLYLGNTIFCDTESIIYSRAYNIFITDKYICYSMNNMKYEASNTAQDTKLDFENRALTHLSKLEDLDKIFYNDYFSDHEYKP